jgi:histidinol-phosphatase (PHP family)
VSGLWDSHLHTPLCGHAAGSPAEFAKAAQERGLSGLVFTEHAPMPGWFDPGSRMRPGDLPRYLAWVGEAKGILRVGIGLEMDYHPGTDRPVAQLAGAASWDYLIGSVHHIGAWGLDDPQWKEEFGQRDLEELDQAYYQVVIAAARSGLFDAVGHLDLPKKFGQHYPASKAALAALDAIAAAGLALDYNTAGLRKPAKEVYPGRVLLQEAIAREIPLVLGSDAHRPAEVGWAFPEAAAEVEQLGGRLVHFLGRQPVEVGERP